jgi:hypothetical protein
MSWRRTTLHVPARIRQTKGTERSSTSPKRIGLW